MSRTKRIPGAHKPLSRAQKPLRLSRFQLAGPPTPRDTEASTASAIMHDALGPVGMCSFIGLNARYPNVVSLHTPRNGALRCTKHEGLVGVALLEALVDSFRPGACEAP
jgi:hypothetical protein